MTVVDYAFGPRPSVRALRGAGVTGVSRYLSWLTVAAAPKVIRVEEFAELRAAGLAVVLNWEYGADDLTLPSFDAVGAAREAVRQARALGYPDGCAIYYSVDTNVTAAQWPTVRAKLRDVAGVHGLARTGLYGPWDALEWARRDGVATWFWQAGMSTSWSGGRNAYPWPGAHLRQVRQQTIDGADCDISNIIQPNYGQYGVDMNLTDPVPGTTTTAHPGDRLVSDILGDQARLRAVLYGEAPAPAGTPLAQLLAGPPPATVALTDADRAAIVADLAERLPTAAQLAAAVLDAAAARLQA